MSVQLIVYPQNYDGTYNSISSYPTEFIVNGINFSGMSTANSYDSSVGAAGAASFIDTINNQPSIINTWQRFRTTSAGTPALPTNTGNDLVLSATSSSSNSGVYQKLTNLTIGQTYSVIINSASIPTGKYQYNFYPDNAMTPSGPFGVGNVPSSNWSFSITATDTNMTFFLSYYGLTASTWTIEDISIQPLGPIPSSAIQLLGNGQVICDLYEDEDLPLTLSVDDFKNVAEKVQSYSKAFNLPSTKRNNRIFNAIFEVTRSDDGVIFNAYKKTQCVLKQDGFILFEGYLRLLDVTDKEGEISYNVNLYSEVIALADTLKDRAFRDLDFTELEHDYNKTQIKYSWNDSSTGITYTNPSTSGFRDANSTVKYPFVDWNHNYPVVTTGNPVLPSLETSFRPFINIKYLVERIFEASDFTFTSTFFDTTDFEKLYMDFNWGADNAPVVFNTSTNITRDLQQTLTMSFATLDFNSVTPPPEFGYSAGVFTAITDNQIYNISFDMIFKTPSSPQNLDVEWVINGVSSFVFSPQYVSTGSPFNYSGNFTVALNVGDTIYCKAKSSSTTMYMEGGSNSVTVITSSDQTTNDTLLGTLRGELGQWDFLKGLITMFNLVTLVDEDNPNNILIEPYSDVFIPTATGGTTLANRGIEHDWTDKIDISEMKLTPLTDLNKKTMFKFVEDDDDYAFNQYKNLVGGHLYGSKKFNAGNEFNILDGEEEIVAEPFAATVVKSLMSQFPEFITPAIYGMTEDGESEGFENSPRIMYNNGIKSTGASYEIPAQNGVTGSAAETDFLQFSHLSDVPTITSNPPLITDTIDFHFGECQLMTGVGVPTVNNLYNMYWLPYYNELYNPNTRTMTIKVNLSPADINTFKFNDRVFIKNRVFRVNKIDYKPNDLATVEFILIP